MSEGDVSHIRDEELLRRMWQQSEDFSKKKEIRAHMYRLREERLRDLYSPEPAADKGSAFSASRGHTRSFADQTFQSMKSKEVRDAGSPPKEFSYRGQDSAAWTSDEHRDTCSSRHTSTATTAEQRYQKSATATLQETTSADTGTHPVQRASMGQGELLSRKVEYPTDNERVVVEKRTFPDGTEITTTEREFRTPIFQESTKEHHAHQTTTKSGAVISSSLNFNESTVKTSQDSANQHIYSTPEVGSHFDNDISDDVRALASQETSKIRNENNDYVASSQKKVRSTSDKKEQCDTRAETTLETGSKHQADYLDQYQTTYQSDYTDKKVSQDLSPTHQAWASTLRGDSPSKSSHSSNSTLRRSTSPEKPLNQSRSRTGSPSKYESNTSFDRLSSDITTSDIINSNSTSSHCQKSMSLSRSSASPDRKISNRRSHSASPDKTPSNRKYSEYLSRNHEHREDYQKSSTRYEYLENQSLQSSQSPEKQDPGYLQPTVSSTNHSQEKYDDVSELEHNTRSEYSPGKKIRSESPDTHSTTTHDKTTKNTYRDESYDHVDNVTVTEYSTSDKTSNKVFRKSSSPARISPTKDLSAELVSSLRQNSPSRRSPSPPKGPVTFESDLKNVTNVHNITKEIDGNIVPDAKVPLRDSSPSKYATYTKKKELDKNSPRDSVSPLKMPMGSSTHTNIKEFIKNEKTMEEHNRNDIRVDRSRQLVTPSTSPTRKPKVEKDSSTGQSSPTTSVSEIVYFSSPRQSENRNVITDLGETISRSTERSPSPTKIPQHRHKVPSPEKHVPTNKDNLPRKSSLKKTSFNYTTQQTLESSTTAQEIHDTALTEHKVVKKDRPDKDNSADEVPKRKEKPPLQRRETYEDRCRKILGMTESDTGEKITINSNENSFTTTMTTSLNGRSHSNSPRNSPTKKTSPCEIDKKYVQTNKDFITSEKESSSKVFNTDDIILKKSKSSSRNSSPTKLRDIISDEGNVVAESHKTKETNKAIITNDEQIHTSQSFDTRRTPSPCKKDTNIISDTKHFISKEKQREILSKVHNSLRKLSPTRDDKSKAINKLDVLSTANDDNSRINNAVTSKKDISAHNAISNSKSGQNLKETNSYKTSSRNASPDKKSSNTVTKKIVMTSSKIEKTQKVPIEEKTVDSSKKNSTKFFVNQSQTNSLKLDAKVVKNDRDFKKSTKIINKQNINTSYKNNKTTQLGNKPINKPNINTESVKKVSRTTSDNSIKYKKSTQRMSSKPEIHVNDISHNKSASKLKVNEKKTHRSSSKDTLNITNKPKSATALNTVSDTDDDIIIDIQQAKSSRENSPDRICPTPVFEDTGKPRLPDEVSEPDDDILKRMHHTIHEAESIVDDIVEISEDDELFVKKRVHSNLIDENLRSDECMLTVSEKVSKFTNIKDNAKVTNRYPLENEYDSLSKYQDDYTKLSVNDKTHLFIETADNEHDIKVSKCTQNSVEHNVSDKVNKFIKTAEKFLNEAHLEDSFGKGKADENPKQVTESEHSHDINKTERSDDTLGTFAKETVSSHAKVKNYVSPNLKTPDRVPVSKITTLRSNEAIKKAKALFENMASSNKLEEKSSAKLADIGVNKRQTPETTSSRETFKDREDIQRFKQRELTTESLEKSTTSQKTQVKPTAPRTRSPQVEPTAPRTRSPQVEPTAPRTRSPQVEPTAPRTRSPQVEPTAPRTRSPQVEPTAPRTRSPQVEPTAPRTRSPQVEPTAPRARSPQVEPTAPRTRSPQVEPTAPRTRSPQVEPTAPRTRSPQVEPTAPRTRSPQVEPTAPRTRSPQVEPTAPRTRSPRRHVNVQQENDIHRNKTVQKQETNNADDIYEVSTRRGSGKFGVELKRTGQDKTAAERRRPSDDLRQPCIEDIYHVEVLEQMLEKVVGYEQRRRIRAQIRVAKKKMDITVNMRDVNVTERTSTNKRSYTDSTVASKAKSPTRRASPEKKIRSVSPLKSQTSPNKNRFNEYASAYMKKVGLNNTSERKVDTKRIVTEQTATTTSVTVDNQLVTEKVDPKKKPTGAGVGPGHEPVPSDKLYRRTPSPQFKRPLRDSPSRTPTDGNQIKSRLVQEDKPAWVTNRTLKNTTSETRTCSKKLETDKKRAASPSKVVARPTDVITSGYGPGPLDADGRPLFGIKALRNGGGANYRVKGTVVQQEYHSHNGGEPEGTVSVTTYSNDPDYLDRVLQDQHDRPSRIHGLAAITTTKKFGGNSGVTMKQVHNKKEDFHKKTKDSSNEKKTCVDVEQRKEKSEYIYENTVKDKIIKSYMNKVEDKKVDTKWSQQKKTVRQNSVKTLADKYTDSVSGSSSAVRPEHPELSEGHAPTTHFTHTTRHSQDGREVMESETREVRSSSQRSFLDSGGVKVTGVRDILTRMKNADIVVEAGDSGEEAEARALLNKFLGATVLMAGMQSYVTEQPALTTRSQTVRSCTREVDVENCWDEQVLRQLLEQSTDYEQRRRVRARIRALMAEQQACVDAVTEVLEGGGAIPAGEVAEGAGAENREEEVSIESSVRRNSSESVSRTSTTTKSSTVIESMTRPAPKPVSAFAKFRQLDKQNSTTNPSSPKTPQSPGSPSQPYFKFTEPALACSAITIKERLLQWCRDKTREYENVKLENFSTSWSDGLAFCALVHHFLPDAFDYSKLTADKRRHNFTLAFKVADEKAGIYPLLDVDDMVAMRKPDWKCVFTYVQSIHRRFKDQS